MGEGKLTKEQKEALLDAAKEARTKAYAPYSGYAVGAAVYTASRKCYTGCNIENASYGAANCAERTAIFKAVSEGERELSAVAIAGGKSGKEPEDYAYPCGICRQVMQEFGKADMPILIAGEGKEYQEYTLADLLPYGFGGDKLA